jgi:hypothetical protein
VHHIGFTVLVNILVYTVEKKYGLFSGGTKEKGKNDRQRVNFNCYFIQLLMPRLQFPFEGGGGATAGYPEIYVPRNPPGVCMV